MLNNSLRNTVRTWNNVFHSAGSFEEAWTQTVSYNKVKRIDTYESFEAFKNSIELHKDEVINEFFIVAGLNGLLDDTDTMEANKALAVKLGYTYDEKSEMYRKFIGGQLMVVNPYMINTHSTNKLQAIIEELEKEALKPVFH